MKPFQDPVQDRRLLGGADLDLLEAVFEDMAGCPFFVKDAGLRYVAANPAMAALCGVVAARDVIGRTAWDFFPGRLARRYEVLDEKIFASGKRLSNVVDLAQAQRKSAAWLIFSRTPIIAPDGRVVGVVATGRQVDGGASQHAAPARLRRAATLLRADPSRPLDLGALARRLKVSESQVQRDFKAGFGMSPRAFLRKLRIEKAMVLREGEESVASIAQAVGFSDHSAFSRAFRTMAGMSPRRYRSTLPENGAQN